MFTEIRQNIYNRNRLLPKSLVFLERFLDSMKNDVFLLNINVTRKDYGN